MITQLELKLPLLQRLHIKISNFGHIPTSRGRDFILPMLQQPAGKTSKRKLRKHNT